MAWNLSKWCNWPIVFISFKVHQWVTRCVNTVLLVTSPPVTLPPSLVGPTRTAPIWVSRPWSGGRPRWTASVPLRTRQPCWSAPIATLCATTVRRLWNMTSHACDDVFLTKPKLSTVLYQKQTESFQTFLSSARGGFPRSGSHPDSILSQILACLNINTEEEKAEHRDEWHVSGTEMTRDGRPKWQV